VAGWQYVDESTPVEIQDPGDEQRRMLHGGGQERGLV
jgi:hypothetical protein